MIDAVNVIHDRVEQLAEEFRQNKENPGFLTSVAADLNLGLRRELLDLVANIQRLQTEDTAPFVPHHYPRMKQHIDC